MTVEMFSSSKASKRNRFARLTFEKLETRDCPATITLNAAVVGNGNIALSGQIADGPNSGIYVQFGGSIHGGTWTNSDGTYSFLTQTSSLGSITAIGVAEGLDVTNVAETDLADSAPVITIDTIVNTNTDYWTIKGTVSNTYVDGLVVYFGGLRAVQYSNATVQPDGTFSLTCYISESDAQNAIITASTTSYWGLDSNTASLNLM